jgi:hypothetical protein
MSMSMMMMMMDRACTTQGSKEQCIQDVGKKSRKKETTANTWT